MKKKYAIGVAWLVILDALFVYSYLGPWFLRD